MRILFAMTQSQDPKIEESIQQCYSNETGITCEYKREYYYEGVLKELECKEYDFILINETFEKGNNVSLEYLDHMSDKYPNLKIIYFIENSHRQSEYMNKLFSLGIYSVLFKEDLNIKNIVNLMINQRTKYDYKLYADIERISAYNLDKSKSITEEINDDKLKEYIEMLTGADNETIGNVFEDITMELTERQLMSLIALLNENTMKKLHLSDSKKYKKYVKKWNKEDNNIKIKEVIVETIKEVEKIKIVKENVEVECIKEVYKTPTDYKQKVGIISSSNVGSTTISCLLAQYLELNNISCGIIDLSKNKDLYELYVYSSELKEQSSLQGYKVGDYKTIYTTLNEIKSLNESLMKVTDNPNVIIVDYSLENFKLEDILILDKIYIIVNQEMGEIRSITTLLNKLKESGYNSEKFKFIINNFINCGLSEKDISDCLKFNNLLNNQDPIKVLEKSLDTFTVNASDEIRKMKYTFDFDINKLNEEIKNQIAIIANDIYIHNKKEKVSLFNKIKKIF